MRSMASSWISEDSLAVETLTPRSQRRQEQAEAHQPLRPRTMSGFGVDVPGIAGRNERSAPVFSEGARPLHRASGIVRGCDDDRREWQALGWHWREAAAGRRPHIGAFQIRGRNQIRTDDAEPRQLRRRMHHRGDTAAVSDQHHRPLGARSGRAPFSPRLSCEGLRGQPNLGRPGIRKWQGTVGDLRACLTSAPRRHRTCMAQRHTGRADVPDALPR